MYIGALLVVSVLNLVISTYLDRHPELTDNRPASDGRRHVIASGFTIGVLVLAVIVSLFSPASGIWMLFLLFPAQIIAGRVIARTTESPSSS